MRSQFLMNLTTRIVSVLVLFTLFNFSLVAWSSEQLVLFRNASENNDKDNISISPYGANLAIALVVPGANGETATELQKLLGYEGDITNLATALKITEYAKEDSPLKTATSLWIQQGFNVLPKFIDTAKTNFAAEIGQVDFKANPADACDKINSWVDKNTNSKIKKLFDKVESSNRVIAVSAIYFLDEWVRKFSARQTHEEDFTLVNGESKKVQMMRNRKVNFMYGEGLNSQWLEMPYKSRGFSAIIILPNKGVSVSNVIEKLTQDNFDKTIKTFKSRKLDVKLPRFEVEYSTSLKSAMSGAGVKQIFTSSADLSGIAASRDLVVSDVIQKVFIKVDETGTEAAAATGVTVSTTGMDIAPPQEFFVDRPFIFIVKEGNNILFISKVTKP
ncbi:MAG: serpin family protein [Planctomycetaceae bacterium]|jgi:serpin B|nr:serpin family protein [Planctomycetaceae bacterium]